MKIMTKLILAVMVCLFYAAGFTQQKDQVQELSNRVKIVEGQKENFDKLGEFLKDKLKEQDEFIKEKIEVKSKELLLLAEEIQLGQKKNNWIAYLVGFMGIIGVGSIIGLFVWIRKFIISKVKDKAEKLINEKYKEKERELLEMAEKQSEEIRLKEKKSILVINKAKGEDVFMKRFFKEMGFGNVNYCLRDEVKNANRFDLILFNNEKEDKTFDHSTEFDIISKTKEDAVCFYFGPNRFEIDKYKNRVNFTNSRVQLYGNLINSLRYQSLLK